MIKRSKKKRRLTVPLVGTLLLLLGCLCYFSARWYLYLYGDQGFNSILFTLFSGVNGVEGSVLMSFFSSAVGMALLCSVGLTLWCCHRSRFKLRLGLFGKRVTLSPVRPGIYLPLCAAICVLGIWQAVRIIGLSRWLANVGSASTLISQEYVSPDDVEITFPEKKRNLIYIYLESMETTFASKEQGGAMEECVIPELYTIARENVSFSDTEGLGGWGPIAQTNWTTAGMVAQAGGIPLLLPFGANQSDYMTRPLTGATLLWDILREEGYVQAMMCGSDKNFSGRVNLMTGHGIDTLYDWNSAQEDGIVPQGYKVWWGIEDSKLYTYAKQKLTELAAQDRPFSFTLLTVDTHMPDGYTCPDCPDRFADAYENVYACASAQAAEFIRWLQEQPFYENTTVILCGDHPTMDNGFAQRAGLEGTRRRVYNCVINGAARTENTKNRIITPMDMFPTTLAALGCGIQGERLGLGTNLYSDVPTLAEKMGVDALNHEIEGSTLPYLFRFLLEPGQGQWLLDLMPELVPQ